VSNRPSTTTEEPGQELERLRRRTAELEAECARLRESLATARIHELAVRSSATAIALADAEFEITFVNPAWLDLWHLSDPAEVLGRSPFDFLENHEVVQGAMQILQEGRHWSGEIVARRRDGSTFEVHCAASAVWSDAGAPLCFIGSFTDISDAKRTEKALGSIFRAAPTGIGVVRNRVIETVNERICEMLGYEASELVGQGARMVYPTDADFEYVGREKYRQIAKRGTGTVETRWLTKDGRILDILLSSTPFDPDNLDAGVTFTALDITARKRMEEELRFTQFAVDHASDAAFWIREDGRFTYVNEAACRSLGYSRDELLSMTVHDIDPDFPTEAWPDHWRDLRQRRSFAVESYHRTKDGRLFPVEILVNWLEFGGAEYNCAFARDISARRLAEAKQSELEELLRQAQKLESVGRLAGGIAHDFNNVLTAIQGNAELLRLDLADGSPAARSADQIVTAAERAAELTRQLLAFARKGKIQTVPVAIHDVIREVHDLLSHGIDRRIELHLDLAAEQAMVAGDPSQLQSALLNLGLNARDAMPKGGQLRYATRNVEIDGPEAGSPPFSLRPGRYLEIVVSDTGVGMDRDLQDRIFEPFFTTKGQGEGTGLGLASVYGTVKSHHGSIVVDTEPGKGTTFRVLLPLTTATPSPKAADRSAATGSGHILIVDDEEAVRDFARAAVQSLGYTASVCGDGEEAIRTYAAHQRTIDLVILDLVMPRLGGEETFHELKKINPDVKVILSSGYSTSAVTNRLITAGAVGLLSKPFQIATLANQLAHHLASKA
jgi:two-component system cell cycle sensor histidine kinase/response regulator CckA